MEYTQTNLQKTLAQKHASPFVLFKSVMWGKASKNLNKLDISKRKSWRLTAGRDFEAFFVIPVCRITEVSSVHSRWLLKGGQVKYAARRTSCRSVNFLLKSPVENTR